MSLRDFSTAALIAELMTRHEPGEAPAKTERIGTHFESVLPVGADAVAHLTMTDEAVSYLQATLAVEGQRPVYSVVVDFRNDEDELTQETFFPNSERELLEEIKTLMGSANVQKVTAYERARLRSVWQAPALPVAIEAQEEEAPKDPFEFYPWVEDWFPVEDYHFAAVCAWTKNDPDKVRPDQLVLWDNAQKARDHWLQLVESDIAYLRVARLSFRDGQWKLDANWVQGSKPVENQVNAP